MRYYIFITKVGRETGEFKKPCKDDLTARYVARGNPTVIRVETENARVVYRKPMSEKEMAATLRGRT